jgi:protein-S-isoprenylcysteine O-methyltransferase Ste14
LSRLPSLGPRGEGWVAGQLVLLWAIVVAALVGGVPVDAGMLLVARLSGAVLVLLGLAIVATGWRQLGVAFSILPRPRDMGSLIEAGLYARVRHPIYTGVIVTAAGGSLYGVSPIAGLVTLALFGWFDLKARREEAWLSERYPTYAEYIARTRRFIPGIY